MIQQMNTLALLAAFAHNVVEMNFHQQQKTNQFEQTIQKRFVLHIKIPGKFH